MHPVIKANLLDILPIVSKAELEVEKLINRKVVLKIYDAEETVGLSPVEKYFTEICDTLNFDVEAIKKPTKKREIVAIRQLFCYTAKQKFNTISLHTIAIAAGMTDHTIVIHSIGRCADLLSVRDELMTKYYNKIKPLIYAEKAQDSTATQNG